MNMKKVSMDTWIQLLGMLGVIASLVFVGLQMRQSQQIALAAQQTERMQVFTDIVNAFTESGVQYEAINLSGEERVSSDSFNPAINVAHQALWVFENDFLQYSLGLMDESIWQAKSNFLLSTFSTCIGRQVFNQRKGSLDTRIVELIDAVPGQSCDEASVSVTDAADAQETTSLNCVGDMRLGNSNIDTNDGIPVLLEASLSDEKSITIMGQTYEVEETPTEYNLDPFENAGQIALNLDRYTLSLIWIYPNYSEQDTMIFEANCSLLGEPRI